ncbi:hypothetical protein AMAG_15847 [Allomyces macrogynus ATCC 38327]|uniref:TmcB/TmcC TPR repeats domain-containing protein n=1 Tax=Allomyces macrogynus (strain ATCC 38327) TaxID=578462 RepID=A0A0L0T8Z2_ALLM3|nr:hypothetical protein AMAG_15847 [Allomyces macrogynus ATCC 38327]|eukprot:KNE71186.1 hypothetical protein AMAG_15847 [Allomyces macrogynus ATCC 38327]
MMPIQSLSVDSDVPDSPTPGPAATTTDAATNRQLPLPVPTFTAGRPSQSTPSVAGADPRAPRAFAASAGHLLHPYADTAPRPPRIISIDSHAVPGGESARTSAVLDEPARARSPSVGRTARPLPSSVSGILAAAAVGQQQQPGDGGTQQRRAAGGGTGVRPSPGGKASASRAKKSLRSVLPTNLWEDALFSLAYVTVTDNELPPTVSWLLKAVEDLQLLSFALTLRLHHDVPEIALAIVEPIRLVHDYAGFQVINAIALVLVLLTVVLALLVAAKVARSSKVPISALRLLRFLFTIEMSALSIPIAQLLLAGLNCGSGTVSHYDEACFGSKHLPLFVMDVVGIAVFAPLMLVASLVFLETSPTSLSPDAKPHGRVDFIIVAARLLFVALYTFIPETPTGNWIYASLVIAGLLYLVRAITLTQPWYHSRMTAMRLGFMTAATTSMILSMVAYATGATDAWLTMFVPSAVAGVSKVEHQMTADEEPVPPPVVAAGKQQQQARRIVALSQMGLGPQGVLRSAPASPTSPAAGADANGAAIAGWVAAVADANALPRLMEKTSMEVLNEVQAKKEAVRDRVFESPLQVEACIRFIRENPTPNQITVGLQLLERGLIEFDDTLLLFIAATYLAAYFGDAGKTAADELIEQIKARPIRFDEKFLIYAKERQEREDDKLGEYGAQGRGLLESAEFQNMDRKSKVAHLLSLYAMRELFETVRTHGSLVQLSNALTKLTIHRTVASETYARLLIKFPKSKSVLRSYAQFLISVDGNQVKATQLLALVDDAEGDDFTTEPEITFAPLSPNGSMLYDPLAAAAPSRDGSFSQVAAADAQVRPPRRVPSPLAANGDSVAASRATFHASTKASLVDMTEAARKPTSPVGGRAGQGMGPNATGSQTSGTSVTREQRQQLESRRQLIARVTRPLKQLPAILVIGGIYLIALIAGFVVCVTFFGRTRSVMLTDFALAKQSRRYIITVMDSIQRILTANWYVTWPDYTSAMTAEFASAFAALKTAWARVTDVALPFLGNDPTAQTSGGATLYRVAVVVKTTIPEVVDYEPGTLALLELVQSIASAGAAALQLPALGGLTFARVQSSEAIKFVFDNFWVLLTAVNQLPLKGIAAYDALTTASNAQLIVTLVVAVLALVALGVFLFVQPLRGYFDVETKILAQIRKLPKRAAMELVTTTEEEIEAFREFTSLEDVVDVELASQTRVAPAARDEEHQAGEKMRVARLIVVALVAVAALTMGMFGVAFQTQNVTVLMRLMTQSVERRFFIQVNQMLTRQLIVPDQSLIRNGDNLRTLRSNLYDFRQLHAKLTSDNNGLSTLFPQYTLYLANSATVTAGTDYAATVALDAGLAAYIDDASRLITAINPSVSLMTGASLGTQTILTSVGNVTVTPPAPDTPAWVALQARGDRLNLQLNALDTVLGDQVLANVNVALTGCILVFTATIIAAVALATHVQVVVFRRLREKARALVAVLFLMPQSVTKDAPELAALVKSGGLTLQQAAEVGGGGA